MLTATGVVLVVAMGVALLLEVGVVPLVVQFVSATVDRRPMLKAS